MKHAFLSVFKQWECRNVRQTREDGNKYSFGQEMKVLFSPLSPSLAQSHMKDKIIPEVTVCLTWSTDYPNIGINC